MWNGKTFPLSPSTEKNLKAVIYKGQTRIATYPKFLETVTVNQRCASRISIDMELLMQKKCVAHHSA